MSALPDRLPAYLRPVPADIASAARFDDWRARIWWPVGIGDANRLAEAQARRALAWVAAIDDADLRDAALLALSNVLAYGRAILIATRAAAEAARAGMVLVGESAEIDHLQGGTEVVPVRSALILQPGPIHFPLARRFARISTWAGRAGAVAALIKPDAVAVTHNPLMQDSAARGGRRIGFAHADRILAGARGAGDAAPGVADHAAALADVLAQDIVDQPYRERAVTLLKAIANAHLERAARDLRALRGARLPDELWSGSGGVYAARALGLEVLRRGGAVVRFDHGTPKGFVTGREINALVEYAVSSEFVVATPGAAGIALSDHEPALLPWKADAKIHGAVGDPTFARLPAARRLRNSRPRVVYAPTQFLGFRQLLPVQLHDIAYLDWQLRIVEALRDLPVEHICQPHPEGLLKGRPHPLEPHATTMRGNFHRQLTEADVFVFDYPSTTALWEAACTDARIVFLDIGSGRMTPEIAALFAKRARVIDVAYDEGNRPVLDPAALADAVLAGDGDVDPMPIRRLLAGDR